MRGSQTEKKIKRGGIDKYTIYCYNDNCMAEQNIDIPTLKCLRCNPPHEWHPRSNRMPLRCPKCGSPYWNRPKVRVKGEK